MEMFAKKNLWPLVLFFVLLVFEPAAYAQYSVQKLENPISVAFLKNNLRKDLPRLVLNKKIEKNLRAKLKTEPVVQNVYEAIKLNSQSVLEQPIINLNTDDSGQKGLSGLATFEVNHESIVISLALTYDFLYDYLMDNNQDLTNSQAVFQKWGDQIIRNEVPNNNWNLFQARSKPKTKSLNNFIK